MTKPISGTTLGSMQSVANLASPSATVQVGPPASLSAGSCRLTRHSQPTPPCIRSPTRGGGRPRPTPSRSVRLQPTAAAGPTHAISAILGRLLVTVYQQIPKSNILLFGCFLAVPFVIFSAAPVAAAWGLGRPGAVALVCTFIVLCAQFTARMRRADRRARADDAAVRSAPSAPSQGEK
jgi:hypothetical protein